MGGFLCTDLKIFNLKEKSLVCALSVLDLHGGIFSHEEDEILIICYEWGDVINVE